VVGGGGKCGSTAIDREFLCWMSKKFGHAFDNLSYEKTGPGSSFMKAFESHKRDFGSDSLYDHYEVALVIPGAQDSVNYIEEESMVKFFEYVSYVPLGFYKYLLSRSDMMTFFRPVIGKIIALIQEQIDAANKTKKRKEASVINVCQSSSYFGAVLTVIQKVILVGGFGESKYLNDQLRTWCNSNGKIRLICPPNP